MYASSKTQFRYPWWAGNARFIDLSNTFIVAHVAQAALITLWVGVFTLFELVCYSSSAPMYEQGLILLPHLAAQGWGVGSNGEIVNTYPYFVIGVVHAISAGVLGAGAWFHRNRLSPSLESEGGKAAQFHFTWDDSEKLGFILGHHLMILGLGAILLVAKAMFFGGLYDATIGEVRLVTEPTLDIGAIASYRTHLFDVNNLEDLVGGHIYVAVLLLAGGIWHIVVPPFNWVKQRFLFSGDGILAYSLFGIALAGFAASYYCGFNSLAYPVEFYGPTLELKSAFLPFYYEPNPSMATGYTSRVWLANAHFYLAFFFLQGGLWHYQRAMGFDIGAQVKGWRRKFAEDSGKLAVDYQKPFYSQPKPMLDVCYEMPQSEPQPVLKFEQPFESYYYCQSQGIETSSLTDINGIQTTLYQTKYHPRKIAFYQRSALAQAREAFERCTKASKVAYGQPRKQLDTFNQPMEQVIYEPSQSQLN